MAVHLPFGFVGDKLATRLEVIFEAFFFGICMKGLLWVQRFMLNVPPYSAFLMEILEEGKERTDMVLLFGVLAHCKRTFFLSPYKQTSASLAMKSRNSKCVDMWGLAGSRASRNTVIH
jgi:hypothetical protein